ncbi:NAD-P-binding protein, partial [Stereum hirsutum FP-91666 SS1]|uniref:NAD-P-binding protein n=1 Tax=Stereum hirsutum (strain FP-91666) TaxID=721885 RepID=UPI0004449E5C
SGGIGQATARLLASRGLNVAIHYFSNSAVADSLVSELTSPANTALAHGPVKSIAFKADLGDMDQVRKMYEEVVEKMGHIDVLYNNAAMSGKNLGIKGRIGDIGLEEFETVWRTNVQASFLVSLILPLTQLCIPHMEEQKFGRIVFCSSIAAATGGVVSPAYASSKSALHGIMHWVAKQYIKCGINLIPMGRFGMPEEIAAVVELLISNSYMTNKVHFTDSLVRPFVLLTRLWTCIALD